MERKEGSRSRYYNRYNIYHRLDRIQALQTRLLRDRMKSKSSVDQQLRVLTEKIDGMKKTVDKLENLRSISNSVNVGGEGGGLTISIEGVMGAGKTTVLQKLAYVNFPNVGTPSVYAEPVDMWKNFNGMNLLVSTRFFLRNK